MSRVGLIITLAAAAGCLLAANAPCAAVSLEYPIYVIDIYNPDNDCWKGMSTSGTWPVPVDPKVLLVGQPPSDLTGISLPPDYWVEVRFRGHIVTQTGGNIKMRESGRMGEMALVFLTDDFGREYPLTRIQAEDVGSAGVTDFDINIEGVEPGFVPTGIRLVSIDDGGGSPGFDIMSIRAAVETGCGVKACEPIPPNRAHGVDPRAVLRWSPMQNAAQSIVYLGADYAAVAAGTDPVTDPPLAADVNYFDPAGLAMGDVFFWRVDQIDTLGGLHRGDIWSFEVDDKLIVDDFEAYGYSSNYIFRTWKGDYYTSVDTSMDPTFRCDQSMEMSYIGDRSAYLQAMRTFEPALNFRAMGVEAIDVAFRGSTGNDSARQMGILLGDDVKGVAIPYNGDPEHVSQTLWRIWRIPVSGMTGIDINDVQTVAFEYSNAQEWPDDSTLYFDDLTLYPARCLPEHRPAGDFDDNCVVDFIDAEEVASNWLRQGLTVVPVAAPNQPVARYEFEDDFIDSAGSFAVTPIGTVGFADGVHGRAVQFDDSYLSVNDAAGMFAGINETVTVMFWQQGFDSVHHTDTICCSDYTYGVEGPALSINLGCWLDPGRYNFDCGYPFSHAGRIAGDHTYKAEWCGRWNHWAFVKDTRVNAGPGINGVMKIYFNGALYDIRYGSTTPVTNISQFFIGTGWYGYYDGLLDDFRIYDYPLSDAEIAFAATDGTGVFDQDLLSPAELTGDRLINFDDLSILADNWLINRIWP